MNTLLTITLILVAVALFMSWIASRPRGRQLQGLVNVAEGFQPAIRTMLADAAVGSRGLILKKGSDGRHIAICGVGDIPLAVARDEAAAAEDALAVAMLGLGHCGEVGVASEALAVDDMLVPAAAGKLRKLPAAAGTYYICGRATSIAAADGDAVEWVPCFPIQRVVA